MPKGHYQRTQRMSKLFDPDVCRRVVAAHDYSTLSQESLAKRFAVSETSIRRILMGDVVPGIQSAYFDGKRILSHKRKE